MAQPTRPAWHYALYALFAFFVVLLAWRIIADSGLLPGDTGTDAVAPADETASGSFRQNLGAWPWTLTVFVGTLVLGAALAWAQYRTRHIRRRDWEAGEAKTRQIYKQDR